MLRLLPQSSRALGWRDACLALALFAAVIRALIPQGFMLARDEGEARFVLCTAEGARTVDGKVPGDDDAGPLLAAMGAPCAFAALAALAPPPEQVRVQSAPPASRIVSVALAPEPRAALATHRPQAPRAPPLRHA